ncbi:MAG: type 1 glutamine amidotransferase [Spirochaetales bacterium]|nr:type 1 glutamine amidotransferase [Spirochaetales bacterium]
MGKRLKFLITDSYPKESRDVFDEFGVVLAGNLYRDLLLQHLPDAEYDLFYTSDEGVEIPKGKELKEYDGVLWPGCNLTVYHDHDPRVTKLVDLSRDAFAAGVPQFGSCWAAQMAVYAAGGKVAPNPKGREMGIARKIYLSDEGKVHPMYEGKPPVFDGFISHDDIITEMPPDSRVLSSNDFTPVQAVEVNYKNGVFWATQYHPEYTLEVVSRLILTREEKLTRQGYFRSHDEMLKYSENLKSIFNDPDQKNLRWQYAVDDDILVDEIRQLEFVNWLNKLVIPKAESIQQHN